MKGDVRDVHAVPFETNRTLHHKANRSCSCVPKATRDLNQPRRTIWIHGDSTPSPRRFDWPEDAA
jgi:hypothetical protein